MKRIDDSVKQEAIRLRLEERQGLRAIQTATGLSRGTLSVLLRPYPLTQDEITKKLIISGQNSKYRERKIILDPQNGVINPEISNKTATSKAGKLTVNKTMTTKRIGEITQLIIAGQLALAEKIVLFPYGDSQRYDLVIEDENGFKKIQCKTGRYKNGTIVFSTISSYRHRGRGKKTYQGEIDFFGVYCPELNQCYLIPIEIATHLHSCHLRVDAVRVKNGAEIIWANNFLI